MMMSSKQVFFVFVVLCVVPGVSASIDVSIDELGKIISFYDQFYIYQINGTVTVTNSANSSLYNIEIPYFISTLAVRSNQSSASSYMDANKIFIMALQPLETVSFFYELRGISSLDLSSNTEAVLANGIIASRPRIYSNLFGSLQKAQLEDSNITGRDARVVSVTITNPTSFQYYIDKVEVIKTADMDLNAQLDKWSFTSQRKYLEPFEVWTYDVYDENAVEGEIYWLNTDIFIDQVTLSTSANITRFSQDDLFEFLPEDVLNESINDSLGFLADRVYLRKFVSSSLMTPGELVNVTLMVNNFEPRDVFVDIDDVVPRGFDVVSVASDGSFTASNVSWRDVQLSSQTVKRFMYTLRYVDEEGLGVDYFSPARLLYDGKLVFSQSVPFVRKYVPAHKVFVQKNVKFIGGDQVQVRVSVQNLGEGALENILVKEHLLLSAEFREISMQPLERGVWRIDRLRESEVWETTYITDSASVLNAVPEIFGVPQGLVLQTIILSNVVSSRFRVLPTGIVEIVAIALLVVILALYFLPASFFSRKSARAKRDLSLISSELGSLRKETQSRHESLHVPRASDSSPSVVSGEAAAAHVSRLSGERDARHRAVESLSKDIDDVKKKLSGSDDKK